MPKYEIDVKYRCGMLYEIEAATQDEAEELAMKRIHHELKTGLIQPTTYVAESVELPPE